MKTFRQLRASFSGQQLHPRKDENGNQVILKKPHKSGPPDAWDRPDRVATLAAGNSIDHDKFSTWVPPKDWNAVDGQGDFEEPPLPTTSKRIASGAIVHEDDGRVWVVHPSNGFGGYDATFPKGSLDAGLNLRANAIKEVYEESGLKVELIGHATDAERTSSHTRFYHAKRVGGHPKDMGWETQAVSLVPKDHLKNILNSKVDHSVVDKVFGG